MIDNKKVRNLLNRVEIPYLIHQIISNWLVMTRDVEVNDIIEQQDIMFKYEKTLLNNLKDFYAIKKQIPKKEKVI